MTSALPQTVPSFLLHFMKRYKWRFMLLFASTIAHVFESNVIPYALKVMVDITTKLKPDDPAAFNAFLLPISLYIGMWLLMIAIWRIQECVQIKLFPQFEADIRMGMLAFTQNHSYQYFANNFAGTIAGKINEMPRASVNLIEFLRWRVLSVFWVVVVAIIMLSSVSPLFSYILLAWLITHFGISLFFARKVTAYSHQHSEDQTLLKGHIVDLLTNIATARLFARRDYEQHYVGRTQLQEQASSSKARKAMMYARLVIDVPLVAMFVAMLFLLVHGWQQGWVVPGDIVLVMFTVFNVMGLAWMLGTELPNFFSELGVANQALTLINKPHGIVDVPDAPDLCITEGTIEFDKVNFHYRPEYNIFNDKSLTIPGGQKVGLVGFSGSGKSTFVNLILRFYDVESGRILIDGQSIADVTQDSLRRQIAMIPQDTTLFHRSLMDNIRYGRLEATDAEVIAASKKAHCHEFIQKVPEGYDALVGERGVKLSGGQRQRIAIARAMLKDAKILLLDEATSSLDSATEEVIKESLAELMKGRTTIVIAHRLSTLMGLDRILVFNEGHIVEDGTHDELLKQGGHYAKLWNMQAGGFLPEQ